MMAKFTFSTTYSGVHQRQFQDAMEEGDLTLADSLLRKLPQPTTPEEGIQRLIVLNEAKNALINAYKKYQNLGKHDEIEKKLEELEEFRKDARVPRGLIYKVLNTPD